MDDENLMKNSILAIKDQEDLLIQLIVAKENLTSYAKEIPQLITEALGDKEVNHLKLAIHQLLEKFNSIIDPLVEAKNASEAKIGQLETSYGELMHHLQNEQKKVAHLEQEIRQLVNESTGQVTFCSHLGAVLGNLLWFSSKSSSLTTSWLHKNQRSIGDLISITNTALDSFFYTFNDNFPSIDDEQSQFMISLLGIITNISSDSVGRQFIVKNENGRQLIKRIVTYLPRIPLASGDKMKKLMLMILYNVSLNCGGLEYLIELKVYEIIAKCLDNSPEIQLTALRLIQSILYDLKDYRIYDRMLQLVPVVRYHQFVSSTDKRISDAADSIITSIKKFHSTADTLSNSSVNN